MGVLVTLHDDREDRYPGYLSSRAALRSDIEFPDSIERYELGRLPDDGDRIERAGFDPLRYYRLLGYDIDERPADETTLRESFVLTDDSCREWTTEETGWMSEACHEAGIDGLAKLCYAAIVLGYTCRATRS